MTYVSKVQDQTQELGKSTFRNLFLKNQEKYLKEECDELTAKLIENQIAWAERNEDFLLLKKELNELKKTQEAMLAELEKRKKEITQMSLILEHEETSFVSSVHEDKSVRETLELKDEMIECLQGQLVKVRLNQAENFATIRTLSKTVRDLEAEKEMLIDAKPETISRLQEEIMATKINENNHKTEFAQLKAQLRNLRSDIDSHAKAFMTEPSERNVEGTLLKLSAKGAVWERASKTKGREIEDCEFNIEGLQEEAMVLEKYKIPALHIQIEELTRKIIIKDKVKMDLQDQLNAIKNKEKQAKIQINECKSKCEELQGAASQKMDNLGSSKCVKKQNLLHLSDKLESLSRNQSSQSLCTLVDPESEVVRELEEKQKYLQNKIDELKEEIALAEAQEGLH